MEMLTGVKYPLKKLDHLDALRPIGGIGSFGLAIYENELLSNANVPHNNRFLTEKMICRETARQWFGNFVTAKKWGQVFLHGAFANFFELEATAELDENRELNKFIEARLRLDRLYHKISHPVIDEQSSFYLITEHFGKTLLQQLRYVLGTK